MSIAIMTIAGNSNSNTHVLHINLSARVNQEFFCTPVPHFSTVQKLIHSKTIPLYLQHGSQACQEANDSPNHSQGLTQKTGKIYNEAIQCLLEGVVDLGGTCVHRGTNPLLFTQCTEAVLSVVHVIVVSVASETLQTLWPNETFTTEGSAPNPLPVISTVCPPNTDLNTQEHIVHTNNTGAMGSTHECAKCIPLHKGVLYADMYIATCKWLL